MCINKKTIIKAIMFVFLSTQIFAFAISFLDTLFLPDTIEQIIIDNVYTIRNISFFCCAFIIIIKNKIKFDDILLILFLVFSYMIMSLFYTENKVYFLQVSPLIKYFSMAYFVIRADIIKFDELKKWLVMLARILTVVLLLSLLSNLDSVRVGAIYMEFANAISINIALLVYSGIIENKKIDIILSVISLFALLIYGSRGALLTLCLLIGYMAWLKNKNTKKVIIGLVIGIILIIIGPYIVVEMLNRLTNAGIESRTVKTMISGEFLASSSRLKIYKYLISVLKDNFLFGIGICGDRYYLPKNFSGVDASYAHNLLLELLLDYGVIIGTVIIILIVSILMKGFIREKDVYKKGFFSVFVFISVVQLMVSRSWLSEQNLFVLLALLFTYSGNLKVKFLYRNKRI